MKKILLVLTCFAIIGSTIAQQKKKPVANVKPVANKQTVVMKSSLDSLSYALGMSISQYFRQMNITNYNSALVQKGMNDAIASKPALSNDQMNVCINNYMQKLRTKMEDSIRKANAPIIEANKRAGAAFLTANKTKPGVVALPSGLQYQIIKAGDGPKPTANDKVKCHYHGTLIDGTVFDSSVDRGEPVDFPVGGVIKGWVEALQLMPVGSKWKLFIPSDLAYGDRQAGEKIAPGSTLIFDVELISIEGNTEKSANPK